MALNQEFFDSIQIDVVKKKYYNANKVNAVFDEIRIEAEKLINENESLRNTLASKGEEYDNTKKKLLTLQSVYRETVEKAHERADIVLKEAEERAARLLCDAEEKNARAERLVRECIGKIIQMEEENISYLNSQMNTYLHGNGSEESSCGVTLKNSETDRLSGTENMDGLEQRISLLAKEIRELENN